MQTICIFYQQVGIKFSLEKSAMLMMKSGKRKLTEEIEQIHQERIRTLGEKENYKYLGIL